ncbi:hypothetical protein FB639_004813, partial [Coemansia asiatica]
MPKRKNASVAQLKSKGKARTQSRPKKQKTAVEAKNPTFADPMPESASDEDVDDEDMTFVQENVANLSFLQSMKPDSLSSITKECKKKMTAGSKKQQNKISETSDLTDSEDSDDNEEVVSDGSDLEIVSDNDSDQEEEEEEEDLLEDLQLTYSDGDKGSDSGDDDGNDDDDIESMSEEENESGASDKDNSQEYEYRNSKARRAQHRKAMMQGSMEYEQQVRSFSESKKLKDSTRLPIKTADGRLVELDESDDDDEDSEEDGDDGVEDINKKSQNDSGSDLDVESDSDDSDSDSHPDSNAALDKNARHSSKVKATDKDASSTEELDLLEEPDRDSMSRKQYIIVQQNRLAGLANAVMQDPEKSSKALRTLHEISNDKDVKVKQLGLLTQLAVYRDIIPDYRIRELTEKEKQTKVTREVRQQRVFEENLVKNYGKYLKQLFVATKLALKIFGNNAADVESGTVATRALGELVTTHPHFNYRKDILSALIDIYVQPSSRINMPVFAPMAQVARLAILKLFRDDVSGKYSQNAVDLASKRIKRLSYR